MPDFLILNLMQSRTEQNRRFAADIMEKYLLEGYADYSDAMLKYLEPNQMLEPLEETPNYEYHFLQIQYETMRNEFHTYKNQLISNPVVFLNSIVQMQKYYWNMTDRHTDWVMQNIFKQIPARLFEQEVRNEIRREYREMYQTERRYIQSRQEQGLETIRNIESLVETKHVFLSLYENMKRQELIWNQTKNREETSDFRFAKSYRKSLEEKQSVEKKHIHTVKSTDNIEQTGQIHNAIQHRTDAKAEVFISREQRFKEEILQSIQSGRIVLSEQIRTDIQKKSEERRNLYNNLYESKNREELVWNRKKNREETAVLRFAESYRKSLEEKQSVENKHIHTVKSTDNIEQTGQIHNDIQHQTDAKTKVFISREQRFKEEILQSIQSRQIVLSEQIRIDTQKKSEERRNLYNNLYENKNREELVWNRKMNREETTVLRFAESYRKSLEEKRNIEEKRIHTMTDTQKMEQTEHNHREIHDWKDVKTAVHISRKQRFKEDILLSIQSSQLLLSEQILTDTQRKSEERRNLYNNLYENKNREELVWNRKNNREETTVLRFAESYRKSLEEKRNLETRHIHIKTDTQKIEKTEQNHREIHDWTDVKTAVHIRREQRFKEGILKSIQSSQLLLSEQIVTDTQKKLEERRNQYNTLYENTNREELVWNRKKNREETAVLRFAESYRKSLEEKQNLEKKHIHIKTDTQKIEKTALHISWEQRFKEVILKSIQSTRQVLTEKILTDIQNIPEDRIKRFHNLFENTNREELVWNEKKNREETAVLRFAERFRKSLEEIQNSEEKRMYTINNTQNIEKTKRMERIHSERTYQSDVKSDLHISREQQFQKLIRSQIQNSIYQQNNVIQKEAIKREQRGPESGTQIRKADTSPLLGDSAMTYRAVNHIGSVGQAEDSGSEALPSRTATPEKESFAMQSILRDLSDSFKSPKLETKKTAIRETVSEERQLETNRKISREAVDEYLNIIETPETVDVTVEKQNQKIQLMQQEFEIKVNQMTQEIERLNSKTIERTQIQMITREVMKEMQTQLHLERMRRGLD